MSNERRLHFWATVVGAGVGLGWALHCQAPVTHVQVGMGEDCATCHQAEFQRAVQPLHVGVLSQNCAECHDNRAWSPARGSDHSWPLDGAHAATSCNECHLGEPAVYEGTPTACVDCHAADRDLVLEPSHADFSDDCQSCHRTDAWQPAFIEHEWPLQGAHAATPCSSCHTGEPPVYEGTPTDCVGCHAPDRDAVIQPSHVDFSDACETCHAVNAWQPAAFDHEWPLLGAHAAATCSSCHAGDPPVYTGTPTACLDCHRTDVGTVTDPPHGGFSEDCGACHDTHAFAGATFVHTVFALTGAHQSARCSGCHGAGDTATFAGTTTECVGCHREDYDTSPFPGHETFATTCQDCHVTAAWTPASGGGHPQNRFSITGRHDYACNECHNPSLGPNGAGNADCVGCHEGEHTLARMDGEHAGEVRNYPTGAGRAPNFCLQCHPGGNE